MASEAEGLPNVQLEAIALELPCVSTDCPTGPAEILVPVDDVDATARAIGELLSQPAERARMGAAAAARALDFSLERAIAAYRDVLGEV